MIGPNESDNILNKVVDDSLPSSSTILGVEISVETIRQRIIELSDIKGPPLKDAMTSLKNALRHNPEACNLLLPEEIGAMVAKIYELTNHKISEVKSKDSVKKSKKVDLATIKLDELTDF